MVVRQAHLIAVVRIFLIGCAILLLAVGCTGTRSEAPKEKGHTQTTDTQQGRSPEATSEEEARCEGTRTINVHVEFQVWVWGGAFTTNDVPGCPNKGGPITGTDKPDKLAGREGPDEVHALGGRDDLLGGAGNDVLYGGPGDDWGLYGGKGDDVIYGGPGDEGTDIADPLTVLSGGAGEDAIYGGDGDDFIDAIDANRTIGAHRAEGQRDELYCGKGNDAYDADKKDYVDSSCEKKRKLVFTVT